MYKASLCAGRLCADASLCAGRHYVKTRTPCRAPLCEEPALHAGRPLCADPTLYAGRHHYVQTLTLCKGATMYRPALYAGRYYVQTLTLCRAPLCTDPRSMQAGTMYRPSLYVGRHYVSLCAGRHYAQTPHSVQAGTVCRPPTLVQGIGGNVCRLSSFLVPLSVAAPRGPRRSRR
jgi:hypothetical protein